MEDGGTEATSGGSDSDAFIRDGEAPDADSAARRYCDAVGASLLCEDFDDPSAAAFWKNVVRSDQGPKPDAWVVISGADAGPIKSLPGALHTWMQGTAPGCSYARFERQLSQVPAHFAIDYDLWLGPTSGSPPDFLGHLYFTRANPDKSRCGFVVSHKGILEQAEFSDGGLAFNFLSYSQPIAPRAWQHITLVFHAAANASTISVSIDGAEVRSATLMSTCSTAAGSMELGVGVHCQDTSPEVSELFFDNFRIAPR